MPTIVVTDAQLDGKAVCHFAAPGGGQNPGMEVQTDFEVIAAEPEIDLTYDCVREPEEGPPDSIFGDSFD